MTADEIAMATAVVAKAWVLREEAFDAWVAEAAHVTMPGTPGEGPREGG